jgi:hypothetical protein
MTVAGTRQPALPGQREERAANSELRRCADLGKREILSVKSEERI